MWPEIKRKFFHLTGLLYVVALIYLPRHIYLTILTALLTLEFVIEIVRIKNQWANQWFIAKFGGLFRDEERDHFSGVFWMLAGVTPLKANCEAAPAKPVGKFSVGVGAAAVVTFTSLEYVEVLVPPLVARTR